MKKVLTLKLLILIILISGCEEIQRSPNPEIYNNGVFSLSSIDESKEVSYFNDFSFSFEEEQEYLNSLETEEITPIRIKKDPLKFAIPRTSIMGISISGTYGLPNKNSFARVILVDSTNKEWLILGTDLLFLEDFGDFENICDETCNFEIPITIKEIRTEGYNSILEINSINLKKSEQRKSTSNSKEEQYEAKLLRLQEKISSESLTWTAGETSVSKLPYRELKKLFIGSELGNLNGFQYYKGGVFVLEND